MNREGTDDIRLRSDEQLGCTYGVEEVTSNVRRVRSSKKMQLLEPEGDTVLNRSPERVTEDRKVEEKPRRAKLEQGD